MHAKHTCLHLGKTDASFTHSLSHIPLNAKPISTVCETADEVGGGKAKIKVHNID